MAQSNLSENSYSDDGRPKQCQISTKPEAPGCIDDSLNKKLGRSLPLEPLRWQPILEIFSFGRSPKPCSYGLPFQAKFSSRAPKPIASPKVRIFISSISLEFLNSWTLSTEHENWGKYAKGILISYSTAEENEWTTQTGWPIRGHWPDLAWVAA